MAPERVEHVRAKLLAVIALRGAIARGELPCEAFSEGLGVMVDEGTCYIPDALVTCGEPLPPDARIATDPIIVVEVLSPSTRDIDTTIKLADYFRIPCLRHYLIIDVGRRSLVLYSRQPDGVVTVSIARTGDIRLDPPGLSVAVTDLFP
jgi:Uma2 family endonuclease